MDQDDKPNEAQYLKKHGNDIQVSFVADRAHYTANRPTKPANNMKR